MSIIVFLLGGVVNGPAVADIAKFIQNINVVGSWRLLASYAYLDAHPRLGSALDDTNKLLSFFFIRSMSCMNEPRSSGQDSPINH